MNQNQSWRSGYVVIGVLFVALLISYLDRVNMAVLIADPDFVKDMGIADRPDLRGLLMSVFLWVYGAAALFLSFWLDKVGARKGLVFIAIIWAISMFFGGVAWSFSAMLVSRVILGFGEGVQLPLNSMVVKNWAPPRERGMANSIWGTGLFVGAAITMPFVAWLIGHSGWRMSMFIMGAMPLVIVIPLVLLFVYDRPEDSRWISKKELDYIKAGLEEEQRSMLTRKTQPESLGVSPGWKDFLTNTDYWISLVGWVLQTWMFWGLLVWLPSYLKIQRGFTWAQMGFLSSLPYMLGTVLLLLSGYLMFRVRRCSVFLWTGMLAYAISMTLAIVSENNYASALWMSGAMGGICWAFGASYVVLQKIVPSAIVGRATGLWQGVAQISGGLVPYLIGWLISINDGSYIAGFVFLIIISLLAACTYFVLYLREGRTFGGVVEPVLAETKLCETS